MLVFNVLKERCNIETIHPVYVSQTVPQNQLHVVSLHPGVILYNGS